MIAIILIPGATVFDSRGITVSRVHVVFRKLEESGNLIVYRVESPDFDHEELIGELRIDRTERQYEFVTLGALLGKAVIPPAVFDLPENQQSLVIQRDYPDCSYGGWTSRIARMSNRLLDMGEFPNEVFGVT
jgi:hypothetical protein